MHFSSSLFILIFLVFNNSITVIKTIEYGKFKLAILY